VRMPGQPVRAGRAHRCGEYAPATRTTSRSSSGVVARLVSKLNLT
jgi:hypothetical protein